MRLTDAAKGGCAYYRFTLPEGSPNVGMLALEPGIHLIS